MKSSDKKQFRDMVLADYKQLMPSYYKAYNNYQTAQVRLEVLSILSEHILSRTKDAMARRKRKYRKTSIIKNQERIKEYQRGTEQFMQSLGDDNGSTSTTTAKES